MSDASGTEHTSTAQRQPPPADVPLEEPLFPQVSLRFLFGLTVFVAGVLWTIRAALDGDQFWAQCVVVVLATVACSFTAYALLFVLALSIAKLSFPVVRETLVNEAEPQPPSTGDRRERG